MLRASEGLPCYHQASVRARNAIWWVVGLAPATVVVALVIHNYGSSLGFGYVLSVALAIGLGIVGLTALFIGWFPALIERVGLRRLAAWLRTWWDEDAR